MRDAIGGALTLQMILVFMVIVNCYLAFSVNYSKAFRVKNEIRSIIEKNEGLTCDAMDQINDLLVRTRYTINPNFENWCTRNGYTVAQFLTSPYNPDVIGVRFWKQQYEDSLEHCVPLIQKESKDGKPIGGVDIANSRFLETLFGSVVTNNTVTRYRVRRDDDCAHILVIDKQSTIDN